MTNEEFLQRYDSGKPNFTKDEIEEMAYEKFGNCIDVIKGDCGRWIQCMTTIFEVEGRRFAVSWLRGLTEMQEDEFDYSEVYEVERKKRLFLFI